MKLKPIHLVAGAGVAFGVWYLFFRGKGPGWSSQGSGPSGLGDPNDGNSIAYACNTAWRLNALGHPEQAASWAARCQAGGGSVPSSSSGQYR